MTTTQTKIFAALFIIAASSVTGLSGCATAARPTRNPAADESALIRVFTDAVSKESGLGSKSAVEDALNKLVRDNSDKFSTADHPVQSLDDISTLDSAEQKKVLDALVRIPGFADRLATNQDVVRGARIEAINSMQGQKNVTTEAVADIHGAGGSNNEGLPFATILKESPELKGDVEEMVAEDRYIEGKTGTGVLGKGCDNLQDPQSLRNVATMEQGVRRDVASGKATNPSEVADSLNKNMGDTLGTSEQQSHVRICKLAGGGCRVFTPNMCK